MDVIGCPHCDTQVDVTGYEPGTVLSCGSCGGEFEVPGPAAARPVGGRAPAGRRGGPRSRRGRDEPRNIPDLLVPSILVTIFCCLIGGIISIVYSAQANSYRKSGQYGAAARAANSAKTWIWISVSVGLLFSVLYAVLILTGSIRT